jgi:capsular polysaccharide export protein
MPRDATVVAWKSRTPAPMLARLEAHPGRMGELEDGMIRSAGLGVHCVPPLSAIVDFSGIYFDPSAPSDLETLLENAEIAPAQCARAAIVHNAIGKYGFGSPGVTGPPDPRRRVLVAGQVEDDRSMLCGGAGCSNLELLRRARAMEGDAWITYKPHPDVEAGLRKGHVPDRKALRHADEIVREGSIAALIGSFDALHVITSLAGFEALLRGKPVTTHGMPFYAGWGLTHDLARKPMRRTRQRSLDELVACTLLLYPRYCDPVTRLPCPPEVVLQRMILRQAQQSSPLITLREWQGRGQRVLHRLLAR